MQPIWNEQITMWHDFGLDIPIEEGTYWINNQVVKAYDSETGELCNLYRIKVNDDLSISYKPHKDLKKHCKKVFETWEQTALRFAQRLDELEANSIALMQDAIERYPNHERIVLTSTGKDSTVTEHIAQISGFLQGGQCVFNNTTLDVADTYKMVKANNYVITNPTEGFYQYVRRLNFVPTRFSRGCCTVFKEGNFIESFRDHEKLLIAIGVRNSESQKRSSYEDYSHNPKWPEEWVSVLPVRKYQDEDIWLYILSRGLSFNPKYRKGYQRVGCAIACPYYTKTTWALDKYWYPTLYKRWYNILDDDFVRGEKWTRLNCTQEEYHHCWNGGPLRGEPTEEVVKEFAAHKGFADVNLARQYFSKQCPMCEDSSRSKNIKQPEVIAMNLKMCGRQTTRFLCKKHLMAELGWTEEDWNRRLADFKRRECQLF